MHSRPAAPRPCSGLSRALLASTVLVPSLSLITPAAAQDMLPEIVVSATATRTSTSIVGTSSTVITADDIARSPAQTVQDIIAQTPGVQSTSLYGGVNGTGSSVDLRGFGATATSNTLFLINGRRLNDLDLQGIDLSSIPLQSIERIEITRGGSGAVLYGDNAVGGVINIVTKTGAGGPPATFRAEGGVGSFNQRLAAVSAAFNSGPWSTSAFANHVRTDGYRTNNALEQNNALGELRYTTSDFSAFVNISGDNQRLGLPGSRTVDPSIGLNQLQTDRRGTNTPFDYADKQGTNITAGFTKSLWDGAELIVDGGLRDKRQQAAYFGNVPLSPFSASSFDAHLQTWSITPRLSIKNAFFGLPSKILTGLDYYDATYDSDRGQYRGTPPVHVYNLSQKTLAGYWQQTIAVLPTTDFSYGGRVQSVKVEATDRLNPLAPGYFGGAQALPLDSTETQHALHVGLEHRFNDVFSVFARAARAFRTPNVDERVASGPSYDAFFNPIPGTFALKTQTSVDVEGGFRIKSGPFEMQTSVYNMDLTNEIRYDPVNFYNTNLDPTRRYGGETSSSIRLSDSLLLRSGAAYTRATFREGPLSGNDVPLVSRYTANAGVTWNVWQKYVVFDATARVWSSRFMDSDNANSQVKIPANGTVDVKLSGEIDQFFWSLSVINLFNAQYYDYAVASSFTPGRYGAYPLPGRTYLAKAGVTF
ncbi:iron complex outermembrane receptor protein [Rhodopseudomonas thermotolerans]|uniref:Iron complex outermembrane recepter protein n=2 Tax=Rhodopseudomonas TaxID=1073 RepID=A0A336JIR0_9BRAD|nr:MULTISPECIES: TonB-dependent receptor [Rhodopseudomonas]RED38767.1 iron complex outermembrane receptor protein [Rhodopseudomonas pentothenatexigens]REG06838.1 iron complex outermembrane receptor protein [Rhodopseudomonas thermotolerans]SSW89587.1 iron complex outermembrane recepter protein [Rhodopseudomonas pentothenatexigens]